MCMSVCVGMDGSGMNRLKRVRESTDLAEPHWGSVSW